MPPTPSRLDLNLLGPVEVAVDGTPIAVDTKKAVALIAYLAVTGLEHSRDHLADLFWPDTDPARARATLRRTLSALRSGLGGRWIEADRSSVRFRPDEHVSVDVDLVLRAAADTHAHGSDQVCPSCVESLSEAAGLVRGEFLEGFAVRGSPAFDDWMLGEAEHLRRRISSVFERLSTAFASAGRYAEAIEAAERWLAVDPLHERAHRTQMLLHAWSGDRSGAVEAYRTCVAILDRELGVEPLEETTELYEAILEEDLPRAPAPPLRLTVAERTDPVGYPLVGRGEQLRRLRAAVASGHRLVIIEGEMGVGKTRMIEELAAELRAEDGSVFVAEAHRSEAAVAYGPIHSVLSAAIELPEVSARLQGLPASVVGEIARLIPGLGEAAAVDPSDSAARTRFLDAVCQALGALGEEVVLCVDDLHWLDGASLELIGYLARRRKRLGVALVVTRRPEDTPIDHPVSVLVEDLSADAEVIRLDRLGREAVSELVGAAGVVGLDSVDVFERTRGLPFFVVEYLDAARAGHTDLPAAVRRLVLSRISDLDAIGRQLITAAAVIGAVVDADLVRGVSGRTEDEVLAGLDDLIRRSLLRERDDGTLEFVHEQLREVAYEESSQIRRRLLHRRAAEHLTAGAGAEADPRIVTAAAGHFQAAGKDAEAARLSVLAGRLATGVFAFHEATGHYENALALGYPERWAVLRSIGDLRTLTGDYGAALAAYEAARAALPDADTRCDEAEIARSIGEVYRRLRRWDVAALAYEEAYAAAGDDAGLRSTVAADWAFVEHRRGDEQRARALAETALEMAKTSEDRGALAHAHNLAGLLAEEASTKVAHLEAALAHAVQPTVTAAVLNNLALALAAGGGLEDAIAHGRRALEVAQAAGDRHRMAALHDNLADFLHRAGDEEGAMVELKQAVALFAEVGTEPGQLEPEVWLLKEW